MKQILQDLKNGNLKIEEVMIPQCGDTEILIKSECSLMSVGTEKMLLEFGKAGYIGKALQRPDKVKMVLDKVRTDGVLETTKSVFNKLDEPLPMGYSNVGEIIKIGNLVKNFKVGDKVVSNGPHAEIVAVPSSLCAKIPVNVQAEDAAFTVLASIALQGIRLANPTLGESFLVSGLGVIGLITVKILRAHGCKVIAADFSKEKLKLAKSYGAECVNLSEDNNLIDHCLNFTNDRGIDGAIIAAATTSNEPVHHAARACRKRGRIILVGVVGLELNREDFYEKELTFKVSCSYGPGRYDYKYENGNDYPLGFVRWTAQRNFEAILELLSSNQISFKDLIEERVSIENAPKAYESLLSNNNSLGVIFSYPQTEEIKENNILNLDINSKKEKKYLLNNKDNFHVNVIGAGNHARREIIPALKKQDITLNTIVSKGGVSSSIAGKRFGFKNLASDIETVLNKEDASNAVFILSRHDTHTDYAQLALKNNKFVYLEKPLCINFSELESWKSFYKKNKQASSRIMMGFNRRFSSLAISIRQAVIKENKPIFMQATINAGSLPNEHWLNEYSIGGGRLVGEACHFIDLFRFWAGEKISSFKITSFDGSKGETFNITLKTASGSIGSIAYFDNGPRTMIKEQYKVMCNGKAVVMNDFRNLKSYGLVSSKSLFRRDKGHNKCVKDFIFCAKNNVDLPITFEEIIEVSQISLLLREELLNEG
tara:strand:- start:15971 stop:18106 length:2136 start_codon:yes stop_codon:yes gene_type:complete